MSTILAELQETQEARLEKERVEHGEDQDQFEKRKDGEKLIKGVYCRTARVGVQSKPASL